MWPKQFKLERDMKYFIDVQHYSYERSVRSIFRNPSVMVTEVISVGIVNEKGEGLYLINKGFDLDMAWKNEHVREDILKPMYRSEYPIICPDISKNDIAMLLSDRGVFLDYIAIRVVSFINKSLGPNEFYVNSIYAWQAFVSLIEYDGYESYWNYSNWRPINDKSNDPRFPKRSFDSRKTAMTEAMFCKDKYDFLEKVKLEIKKKEDMEKCRKEMERIDEQLAGLWRETMKPDGVCLNDVFNPQSDSRFLKIELGIKNVLKGYLRGLMNDTTALNFISHTFSIKIDAKLRATFENFKCSGRREHDIDYYAMALMQMTEEFLKRKAEEKERLDFIVKCKSGFGCYVGGVVPVGKDSGIQIFVKDKDFGFVTWNHPDHPRFSTREECDAPSRPKKDREVKIDFHLEPTISHYEDKLIGEIQKKNNGRFVIAIDYHNIECKDFTVTITDKKSSKVILTLAGPNRIDLMREVIDFLDGKCMSFFCYQFEAVPNVNFRKRCVECGCEFDIKIKE